MKKYKANVYLKMLDKQLEDKEITEKEHRKLTLKYIKDIKKEKTTLSKRFRITKRKILITVSILISFILVGSLLSFVFNGTNDRNNEITNLINEGIELTNLANAENPPNESLLLSALEKINEALKKDSKNINALHEKSIVEYYLQRYDASEETLNEALNLDEDNLITISYLIVVNSLQLKHKEGLEKIALFYSLNPTNEEIEDSGIKLLEAALHAQRLVEEYELIELDNYPNDIGNNIPIPKFSDLGLENNIRLAIDVYTTLKSEAINEESNPIFGILSVVILDSIVKNIDNFDITNEEKFNILQEHGTIFTNLTLETPKENYFTLEGIRTLEEALKLFPDRVRVNAIIGSALFSIGKPKEALEELEKALEEYPDDTSFIILKTSILIDLEEYDNAIAYINFHINKEPNKVELIYAKAYLEYENDEKDKALDSINKAISVNNENIRELEASTELSQDEEAFLTISKAFTENILELKEIILNS